MKSINFSAQFMGGTFGFFTIQILHNGIVTASFVLSGSSDSNQQLAPGLYLITVQGAVPPGGATFTIGQATTPPTPEQYAGGPIYKNYVLQID